MERESENRRGRQWRKCTGGAKYGSSYRGRDGAREELRELD